MRFEVPQFIEIEDKIFGPFTWRQFIYIGGGAGIATVLFFVAPFFIFVLFGLPIAGLTFLLGFYPINNQPFSIFLESMVGYFRNSRLYLWRKSGTGVYGQDEDEAQSSQSYSVPTSGSNLTSLSRKLELKAIQRQSN
ncbi:PrgI family protein [Candidatus Kaiserbacteria bacterium]|nr:PrgI family protein [Candidatus Kaiserbacteria bacterium]MCB9811504.1 PrgI family protein [Candidatus Nomurabacteria bacterium]